MTDSRVEWNGRGLAPDRALSTGVLTDRIVVESRPPSFPPLSADASPVAWTHGAEDWEP
jgi:hypothetical protein